MTLRFLDLLILLTENDPVCLTTSDRDTDSAIQEHDLQ